MTQPYIPQLHCCARPHNLLLYTWHTNFQWKDKPWRHFHVQKTTDSHHWWNVVHYAPFQWCNQVWVWLSWHAGLCAPGRNTGQNPDEEETTFEPTIYLFWVASTHWERTVYRQQPVEHADILTERFTAKHVCYTADNDSHTQHITYSLWIKLTDALNSSFIGITTLHVSGSLSAHHQEFLALRVPNPMYG